MRLSAVVSCMWVGLAAAAPLPQGEFQIKAEGSGRPLPLRVHSFNIRYATTKPTTNEKPWSERSPLVTRLLANSAATPDDVIPLIGLQEALHNQLADVQSGLGAPWTHVGVGRDDGKEAGEFSPILYRTDRLKLLHSTTKWLSPTPDQPSRGWGADHNRIVTVAVFEVAGGGAKDHQGRRFVYANTHLDQKSSEARSKGVGVILDAIKEAQAKFGGGPVPVVLTGDFNSEPGADAYEAMVKSGYMKDAYASAPQSKRIGPETTTTGFTSKKKQERIDFVWTGPSPMKNWNVKRYEVLSNVVDGVYMSDHRCVVADIEVRS